MTRWIVALAFVALASSAAAQTPIPNPTGLEFDHDDFAATGSYVVGYFSSATASAPVTEAPLAKPATCSPCAGLLPNRPTTFQTWYVAVRAVAGGLTSDWSARVPFDRVPAPPRGVRVK